MIAKRFKTTPCYGFVPKDNTMFRDSELFGTEMWKYQILKKVKLWYGTAKSGDDYVKNKIVLGIQSVYVDTMTGNKTTTEQHCGDLSKEDVETKELELKDNDYIKNVYLDFEGGVTHLKFVSKNGESIEVGVENDDTKKTIDINLEKTPHMLQTFFGYFNPYGLRALGFKYISKRDFILINLMGIFRLRHIFKINEEEKQKWDNPEELNKLDLKMKAVAKLCLLPDKTFSSVLQFCGM
jgi:hypothetical protein